MQITTKVCTVILKGLFQPSLISCFYHNRKHTIPSVQTCSSFTGKWVEILKKEFEIFVVTLTACVGMLAALATGPTLEMLI